MTDETTTDENEVPVETTSDRRDTTTEEKIVFFAFWFGVGVVIAHIASALYSGAKRVYAAIRGDDA